VKVGETLGDWAAKVKAKATAGTVVETEGATTEVAD
jgi:hypothetical protein